jgi:hypothetical protein
LKEPEGDMADLNDQELADFKSSIYTQYTNTASRWYSVFFWWNLVLSSVLIASSTTTSVFVSNTETSKYISPIVVALISWVATATTLVISSFGIKENKEKYEKLTDGLLAESAYLLASTGPYAATQEPRKLFVARVTQLYLGSNPSTPALGSAGK